MVTTHESGLIQTQLFSNSLYSTRQINITFFLLQFLVTPPFMLQEKLLAM